MSDLISREAVLEVLYDISSKNYGNFFGYGINKACDVIEHADTAFDKEKVIEELIIRKSIEDEKAAAFDEAGDIQNMDVRDSISLAFRDAIKIVEKGGIE